MEFVRRNVNGNTGASSTSGSSGGIITSGGSGTLETHTIFGQPFNGTNDVRGDLSDVDTISANSDIITDGDLVIRGKDEDSVYTDQNLAISKDIGKTDFTGGEKYTFDADVEAPKFIGDVEADSVEATVVCSTDVNCEEVDTYQLLSQYGNITNFISTDASIQNLTITGAAHFFSLMIDEIKSVGGQVILSPANATIDKVKVTDTGNYKCYFKSNIVGKRISNNFAANDLVVCQTFNGAEGTSYDVSNKFYWRCATSCGSEIVNNEEYHYVILSGSDCAEGSGIPEEGDNIVALGNKNTKARQNAVVISAYNSDFLDSGIKAPSIVQYAGINDYTLSTHRLNVISNGLNQFIGDFKITTGEAVTDLIDNLKYNRLILDKASAVVGSDDVLRVEVSGNVIPVSDAQYSVEIQNNEGFGISILVQDNQFSYSNQSYQTQYSESEEPITYFSVLIRQDGTIIEKVNIPVIFEAGATLQVVDDAITATVTDLSGDISRVEQKADSITSVVNNMKVGGKNLLDDSAFTTYSDASDTTWLEKGATSSKTYGYMNQLGIHAISKPINVTANGYLNIAEQNLVYKLLPDTEYTLSFYAKGTNGSSSYTQGGVRYLYRYKGRVTVYVYPDVVAEVSNNMKTFTTNSNWKRYSYTFKTKSDLDTSGTYIILFRLISDETLTSNGTVTYYSNTYVCMPKLEEGNMATAWDASEDDVKSLITQTAESIEAKIVSEDQVQSIISQNKDSIKAEVFDDMNNATGIDVTTGNITLNAEKTTIKGNLNITDTQNGITVYETATYNGNSTLIPRINLQPKQISDISELAEDTYDFFTKSISESNNASWSLDFGYKEIQCQKDDTVALDNFTLIELRSNSSGTLNPPYSSTCKILVNLYLGTTLYETKEFTLDKMDNYGRYKGTSQTSFSIPTDGTYKFTFASVFSQSATSGYPNMSASLSVRIQKAKRAITYIGTDGMYCHSGANKYLYVNEKETIIQHGFNGIKWDNADRNGNKNMMVAAAITGSIPNYKPVWYPFYNYTPVFIPTDFQMTKIVNDGNSYSRYAYTIDPFKDNGICYLENGAYDSNGNAQETWVILPNSIVTGDSGNGYRLPYGYTVQVINGGFGNSSFNAYVTANATQSHQVVFIDGHRDKNWKVSLNGNVHWETFVYMGSYYSDDCGENQDIWMTLQNGQ